MEGPLEELPQKNRQALELRDAVLSKNEQKVADLLHNNYSPHVFSDPDIGETLLHFAAKNGLNKIWTLLFVCCFIKCAHSRWEI